MQLQAGYILESVRDALNAYAKRHEKLPVLHGLLRSLSTFEVQTGFNLETPANPPSIFAVASNIITRGLPNITEIPHLFKDCQRIPVASISQAGYAAFDVES